MVAAGAESAPCLGGYASLEHCVPFSSTPPLQLLLVAPTRWSPTVLYTTPGKLQHCLHMACFAPDPRIVVLSVSPMTRVPSSST